MYSDKKRPTDMTPKKDMNKVMTKGKPSKMSKPKTKVKK